MWKPGATTVVRQVNKSCTAVKTFVFRSHHLLAVVERYTDGGGCNGVRRRRASTIYSSYISEGVLPLVMCGGGLPLAQQNEVAVSGARSFSVTSLGRQKARTCVHSGGFIISMRDCCCRRRCREKCVCCTPFCSSLLRSLEHRLDNL